MTERAARQSRLDRNSVSYAAERDIDRIFRPLSTTVGASVRRHATDRITPLAYVQIMRDVDAALQTVRGRFPGDREASLYRLVVERCREARTLVFRRSVEDIRRKLRRESALLASIEQEVA